MEMLRRNGPVVISVESVLRLEGSLWWERFVKEVGLEAGVKERGSYGGESGELTTYHRNNTIKIKRNTHPTSKNTRRKIQIFTEETYQSVAKLHI